MEKSTNMLDKPTKMKKLFFSVLMCLMALSMTAQNTPYVIYDYLKVFPNDLGAFDAEPKTIIARLNQNQQYGYGTWRLPTNEELALMKAKNVIGDGSYMTRENQKGIGPLHRVVRRKHGICTSLRRK
jgi:hypothetical protein